MLGSGEQKDRIEPKLQRRARLLEDVADNWVDVVAAPLAGIGFFRLQPIPLSFAFTLRASMAMTETHAKQVIKSSLVGGELSEELAYICLLHATNIRNKIPYFKGIKPPLFYII